MLRRIKISGFSLAPDFKEGDFVVTVKIPLFLYFLRPGDVVVLQMMPYGKMIKRVKWVDREQGQVFVIGNHPLSVDSRQFGPVSTTNLIGKVIWHIPKPR